MSTYRSYLAFYGALNGTTSKFNCFFFNQKIRVKFFSNKFNYSNFFFNKIRLKFLFKKCSGYITRNKIIIAQTKQTQQSKSRLRKNRIKKKEITKSTILNWL